MHLVQPLRPAKVGLHFVHSWALAMASSMDWGSSLSCAWALALPLALPLAWALVLGPGAGTSPAGSSAAGSLLLGAGLEAAVLEAAVLGTGAGGLVLAAGSSAAGSLVLEAPVLCTGAASLLLAAVLLAAVLEAAVLGAGAGLWLTPAPTETRALHSWSFCSQLFPRAILAAGAWKGMGGWPRSLRTWRSMNSSTWKPQDQESRWHQAGRQQLSGSCSFWPGQSLSKDFWTLSLLG